MLDLNADCDTLVAMVLLRDALATRANDLAAVFLNIVMIYMCLCVCVEK